MEFSKAIPHNSRFVGVRAADRIYPPTKGPPRRSLRVSKNLPLGGKWPEGPEGESLAFARNLRACVKLSPPPPAGGAPSQRGPRSFSTICDKGTAKGGPFVIGAAMERYRKTPTPPTGVGCPLGVLIQVVLGVVFRQSTTASKPLTRRPAIIGSACAGLNCRVNARKSPTL